MKKLFTLFSATFFAASAFAQIPNAGFETWTTAGTGSYDNPTSWGNVNPTIDGLIPGTYTCEKGTSGAPSGAAFLKLTSKNIPLASVVAPGVAVSGNLDVNITAMTYEFSGGFPHATRSANLTGKWQHMPTGADHGRVGVMLTKWNMTTSSRDTVAMADTTLTGSASTWADFSIPLTYMSGSTPDTGVIIFMSSADPSAPEDGSYLNIDDVAFAGTVPTGVVSIATANSSVSVFPNPASGAATVYYHSNSKKDITINVTDISGKVVSSLNTTALSGENSFPISLKKMAQGIYMVQIIDGANVIQKKLMVE